VSAGFSTCAMLIKWWVTMALYPCSLCNLHFHSPFFSFALSTSRAQTRGRCQDLF
jgi:hypothetical protein